MGFSRQEYWSGLPFPSPKGNMVSWMNPRKEKGHWVKTKEIWINYGLQLIIMLKKKNPSSVPVRYYCLSSSRVGPKRWDKERFWGHRRGADEHEPTEGTLALLGLQPSFQPSTHHLSEESSGQWKSQVLDQMRVSHGTQTHPRPIVLGHFLRQALVSHSPPLKWP